MVLCTINKYLAAVAGKRDNFKASEMGAVIPRGTAAGVAKKHIGAGTLDGKSLVFNAPGLGGVADPGGMKVAATGRPGGFVSKKDIAMARESVRAKLDALDNISMEKQMRLQMYMDAFSQTAPTVCRRVGDTARILVDTDGRARTRVYRGRRAR